MTPRKQTARKHTPEVVEISERLNATMEENDKADEGKERAAKDLPPGVYPGLAMNDYLAIPAASNTALGWLERSEAHLKAYLDGKPEFVDPQSIGSAFHALVLEGEEAFRARYARAPDDADHKGRNPWKEWVATVPSRFVPMKAADFDAALKMGQRVRQYPAAAFALEGVEATELTVVWIDEATGVKCKARLDAWNPQLNAIVDLKSAHDARPRAFSKAIYEHGYHRQAALYRAGGKAGLGVEPDTHILIAHEKEDPWAAVAYRLREDAITAGHDAIWGTPTLDGLLRRYARCIESDEWPGYADEFVDVTLPSWAWPRVEEGVYL